MNIPAVLRAPDREGRQDRRIQDPEDHLLRRLFLRDGRLRRPDPARHHLSRALGLHLAARPADLRAPTARPTPSASRWSRPTATCAPFQAVLLDLGARLGLPGFVTDDGTPRYPGGYPDYIVNHERSPGIGSLAGFRGEDGNELRPRRAQPEAARAVHRRRLLPRAPPRAGAALLQARQQGLSRLGEGRGLHRRTPRRSSSSSISSRCRNSGWRRAGTAPSSRRRRTARASRHISIRSRSGIRRSRATRPTSEFPFSAITQRPMAHVSLVGLAERLAAPDHGGELPLHATARARKQLGIADGDWVWITSAHRPRQGPRQADGGRQSRHGVDLERHRPARRRRPRSIPTRRKRRAASCSTT